MLFVSGTLEVFTALQDNLEELLCCFVLKDSVFLHQKFAPGRSDRPLKQHFDIYAWKFI